MREFTNKSLWDNDNQDWCEFYYIDNQEVDFNTYSEQLRVEELATEDDNNVCDECKDCIGCDEHCGRGNHEQEYVDDCEDEDLESECDCPICQVEQDVKQLDCYCPECVSDYQKDFIDECLEVIFSGNACPDCIVKSVIELAFKCKELGRQSVKQEISEFLED